MSVSNVSSVRDVNRRRLTTAVALFVFNRPEPTRRVFAAIAEARPERLLLVADGPRADRPGESELCQQVRNLVGAVTWPCDVRTQFSETNLGCGKRLSSGLDWVFSQVEEAIILEDDCLPQPDFFSYCQTLLARYRDDTRVMQIAGWAPQNRSGDYDYYFSRYPLIWGWATWRRAWRHYDFSMSAWPLFRDGGSLDSFCHDAVEANYWRSLLNDVYSGRNNTWDFQWVLCVWLSAGLTVVPNTNLIDNIGAGESQTHAQARIVSDPASEFPYVELRHPPTVSINDRADRDYLDRHTGLDALRGPARKWYRKGWKLFRLFKLRLKAGRSIRRRPPPPVYTDDERKVPSKMPSHRRGAE